MPRPSRLIAIGFIATIVAAIVAYRDRALKRNAEAFFETYGRSPSS